jgi:allophanate hydrolase subunit 2
VATVLGSRSTDTLSGLGPDALTERVELPVGSDELEAPSVDIAPQPHPPAELVLGVRVGPRDDWFADGAVDQLCSTGWQVSSDTDRVGIRLDGEPLERRGDGELKSEAMVRGSIQVPRGGRPIVFGADHPVTGGYPVIAVVDGDDMDLAAQARPGQTLRFRAR